jgi:ribosome assembly protein 1
MMEKILNSLSIKLLPRDLKFTDSKAPLQALFSNWLPLGKNLLDTVVEVLPSPLEMTSEKAEHLMCSNIKSFKSLCKETQEIKQFFTNCPSLNENRPTIAFISKMFVAEKDCIVKKPQSATMSAEDIAAKREAIRQIKLQKQQQQQANNSTSSVTASITTVKESPPKNDTNNNTLEEDQKYEFLAFSRVYSGSLRKGQTLFVLSPRHNPEDFIGKNITIDSSIEKIQAVSKHVTKFTIEELYLMMGRELEAIDEVPCGNIAAIGGLKQFILKSATLSTTLFCPSFISTNVQTTPIVRVAIEPKNPSKIKDLLKGLRLLNQADPCVEILVQENGEHILCAAGEVHLQRCIDDLVNQFAKCEVNVSPPIIPFKETIVKQEKTAPESLYSSNKENLKQQKYEDETELQNSSNPLPTNQVTVGPEGRIEMYSVDRRIRVWVKCKPLPLDFVQYLDENADLNKLLNKFNHQKSDEKFISIDYVNILNEFRQNLKQKFVECQSNDDYYKSKDWNCDLIERIVSFGPSRHGPNVMIDSISADSQSLNSVWRNLDQKSINKANILGLKEFENNLIFGFNLTTAKGPICEEPMQGVAFFVENFQIMSDEIENVDFLTNDLTEKLNLTGQDDDTKSIDTSKSYDTTSMADTERIERKMMKSATNTSQSLPAQCITLMKDACKKAFEAQPQRLMAAMFKCEIMTVSSEALGKLYAVLGKRNAKILDETMKEGSSMFLIKANIPVADSFGLSEEIRKRTSGLAQLHVEFSHYEIIEIDPYWEPKTEEELMHYGDKADFENQARKYMNDVRKRKGLFVREKIVEHAEKQRNLTIK